MLPGPMSLSQLEFVQYGPRNLPLKYGQNRVSNSSDIAEIDFAWVVDGGGGGGWRWWWSFIVKPNLGYVRLS